MLQYYKKHLGWYKFMGGGVTPSYINAYMCTQYLFIRGAIYPAEKIIRYGISQIKGKCLYFNTHY
jgi:hypothetical protein